MSSLRSKIRMKRKNPIVWLSRTNPTPTMRKTKSRTTSNIFRERFEKRFLLVYLSPTGEGPSESSIRKDELKKEWKGRFAIMPYHQGHEEVADELDEFRLSHSLADWLGECRRDCDVERLRWFLRDAETFCQQTFGGLDMTTDNQRTAFEKYVLLDTEKLETAGIVYQSWPAIRDKVCLKFLERLGLMIKKKARTIWGDVHVKVEYTPGTKYGNQIGLYRDCWVYEGEGSTSDRCTKICLQNDDKGPNGWILGVASPKPKNEMTSKEKKRRGELDAELSEKLGSNRSSGWWPWWNWVEEDKRNWDSLVPELHKENEDNGGEITEYFVDRFIEIAKEAVPIIDEIESR